MSGWVQREAEIAAERARDRDDDADAYDLLVRAVWEAATGDTHEGPASVEVLLDAVRGLRAERDALRARAEGTAERTHDHDGRSRLAGLDAIEARARRRQSQRDAIGPTFESHGRADALLLVEEVRRLQGSVDALRAHAELAETERADALSELTRVTRERDAALEEKAREAAAAVEMSSAHRRLVAQVEHLGALVEGRTTPPSDEEIAAHEARGWWLFMLRGYPDVATTPREARDWAQHHCAHPGMGGCRWWPLDTHGCLCAWPVVGEVQR